MLRIAVVDDHLLIRKSLALLISTFPKMEVVVEAANGLELFSALEGNAVDVVLLDVQMPLMDGHETCKRLHKEFPELKVLMLSQHASADAVRKSLELGAHGYFTKSSNPASLETGIQKVYSSGFYLDPELAQSFVLTMFTDHHPTRPKDLLSSLTDRELEIVRMAAKGFDSMKIAEKLFINKRTVETHRKRIMEKTDAKNFMKVVLMALKFNYIKTDELLVE
ncbi:LuxR family transcriptional regulator [Flavobacterium longum]|uniref:response regulator transcription factor n=1 Tax=Flavobacterium longum TaxID=1299340 RepID=UPI0039E7C39D